MPFDEDDKDKNVWFLDHDYLENMYAMFKKVNGKTFIIIGIQLMKHTFHKTLAKVIAYNVNSQFYQNFLQD